MPKLTDGDIADRLKSLPQWTRDGDRIIHLGRVTPQQHRLSVDIDRSLPHQRDGDCEYRRHRLR